MSVDAIDVSPEYRQEFLRMAGEVEPLPTSVLDTISRHPVYPEDSAVYQFISSRVDILCGDDLPKPKLLVVEDERLNAFNSQEYVVVNDGLLKKLEYVEEVDALLAHELTHFHEGHTIVHVGAREQSLTEVVGDVRADETEADLRPLERMDRLGINPYGMVSMMEKLAEESKNGVDITHGGALERLVNLDESLWLLDLQNLNKHGLTPIRHDDISLGIELSAEYFQKMSKDASPATKLALWRMARHNIETDQSDDNNTEQLFDDVAKTVDLTDAESDALLLLEVAEGGNDAIPAPVETLKAIPILIKKMSDQSINLVDTYSVRQTITRAFRSPEVVRQSNLEALVDATEQVLQIEELSILQRSAILEPLYEYLVTNYRSAEKDSLANRIVNLFAAHGGQIDIQPTDTSKKLGDLIDKFEKKKASREALDAQYEEYKSELRHSIGLQRLISRYRRDLTTDDSLSATQKLIKIAAPVIDSITLGLAVDYDETENQILDTVWSIFGDPPEPSLRHIEERLREVGFYENESAADHDSEYDGFTVYEDFDDKSKHINTAPDEVIRELTDILGNNHAIDIFTAAKEELSSYQLRTLSKFLLGLPLDTMPLMREQSGHNLKETSSTKLRLAPTGLGDLLEIAATAYPDKKGFLKYINQELVGQVIFSNDVLGYKNAFLYLSEKINEWQESTTINNETATSHYSEADLRSLFSQRKDSVTGLALEAIYASSDKKEVEDAWFLLQYVAISRVDTTDGLKYELIEAMDKEASALAEMIESGAKPHELVRQHIHLALLASTSDDLFISMTVPARAVSEAVKNLSLEEGLRLIFNDLPLIAQSASMEALEWITEEQARALEDFELISQYVESALSDFIDLNKSGVGVASIASELFSKSYNRVPTSMIHRRHIDQNEHYLPALNNGQLLTMLINTDDTDEALVEFMLPRWWSLNRQTYDDGLLDESRDSRFNELANHFDLEQIGWMQGKAKHIEAWLKGIPHHIPAYRPLSDLTQSMFDAGTPLNYFLLRKTLIGDENSILFDTDLKEQFIDALVDQRIDARDAETIELIRTSIKTMSEVVPARELYKHIYPVLMDLILRRPENKADILKIAEREAEQIFSMLLGAEFVGEASRPTVLPVLRDKIAGLSSGRTTMQSVIAVRTRSELERLYADKVRLLKDPRLNDEQRKKVQVYLQQQHRHIAEKLEDYYTEHTLDESPTVHLRELLVSLYDINEAYAQKQGHYTPLDLMVTLGEKSGALGVRMLQLGTMYFAPEPEVRQRLTHVFDDMRGQSRIQAYRVLRREAQHSPEIAELLADIEEIKPRIGGGSLMTVYDVRTKSGRREAIAVKNPNIEHHLSTATDSLTNTMHKLKDELPGHRDRIELVESMLGDVQQWILDELQDPEFEVKDAAFRSRHHGKRYSGSSYEVLVPQTQPTGTRWIRRDEFIDGKNLSALQVVDDTEVTDISSGRITKSDYKQAVSTLINSYVEQISVGLVHSDVHPGNFRITTDNKHLAVFDRYNLLQLSSSEKSLIEGMVQSMRLGPDGVADQLLAYLKTHPSNSDIEGSVFTGVKDNIVSIVKSGDGNAPEDVISKAIVACKQNGIQIPLNIILITKNMLALSRLAQDAGIEDITKVLDKKLLVRTKIASSVLRLSGRQK